MEAAVRTTCPYCGVGCGIVATPDGKGGAALAGDRAHPANFGRLCSKGSALDETLSLDGRLLHPEIDGRRAGWGEALDLVATRFADVINRRGPDAVAFYVSGQLLTEDYYAANKLIKGWLGTANIDTNSRLCMASSVAGHKRAFGSDTVPGNYADLEAADLIVLVGSNLAWCHPVLHQRILAARARRGGLPRVIVVDPRRTATCEGAELHLPLAAGFDVALFQGLLAHLDRAGLVDRAYVAAHAVGWDEALASAQAFADPDAVAAACRLPVADVRRFNAEFASTDKVVTVYSQGVNQSSAGVDKVNAIVNCHLATGRIGRPGMGPFSVTGQPNAMGGREVGALANQLAAHMDFAEADVDRVARFWKAPRIARKPGLKAVDLFEAVGRGEIEAIWIMATNPAASMPDADRVAAALSKCPFVVVSDCVADTDTLRRAHVKLPALAWGEKEGTVTNSERRISRQRAFLEAPGEALADWKIVAEVARRLGAGEAFAWKDAGEIFAEHAALSAFENGGTRDFDLSGLTGTDYAAFEPVQWPVGTTGSVERMFADGGFFTPDGRARFVPVAARGPASVPDATYPFVLNTGRVRDHWHTMTRTGKSPRLARHVGEPFAAMAPGDAAATGLADGDLVRLESPWGQAVLRLRIDAGQETGTIFVPMHWTATHSGTGRINALVNPAFDPISGQPELKHSPVRVAKWMPRWQGFLLARGPVDVSMLEYWVSSAGEGHMRYEIASEATLDHALLSKLVGDVPDRLDYADRIGGRYRAAAFVDGRLAACVFVGPRATLPDGEWLARQFAGNVLPADLRRTVLAGRPAAAVDLGPVVCACHGVRSATIDAAIEAGCGTPEAIGAATRAGTNCGSCVSELAARLAVVRRTAA
ncbi:MAG: molybdopterin-dependent oxidoreductase [Rhodospirillales bacterium]|nr:molybdopterin-dependent oxidoreductase [Rhodospirillales bacterium]